MTAFIHVALISKHGNKKPRNTQQSISSFDFVFEFV